MTNFKIFLFIFLTFIVVYAKISDKRLCANKDCSEPLSLGKTLLKYSSDDSRILSFKINSDVKIFSKEAGSRLDLWGAEINGERGYIPVSMVREIKILKKNPTVLVDTEGEDDPKLNSVSSLKKSPNSIPVEKETPSPIETPTQKQISPNAVTPPYEVLDGTTLYFQTSENSSSEYSSTSSSIDSLNNHQTENLSSFVDNNTQTATYKNNNINLQLSEIEEKNKEVKVNLVAEEEVEQIEENAISKGSTLQIKPDVKEENLDELQESDEEESVDEEEVEVEDEENEDEDEDEETETEIPIEAQTPKTFSPAEIEEKKQGNSEINDSSILDVREGMENNLNSVISAPEPVNDKTNQFSKISEPTQESVMKQLKETTEESPQEPEMKQLNGAVEESAQNTEMKQLNEIVEESAQNIESKQLKEILEESAHKPEMKQLNETIEKSAQNSEMKQMNDIMKEQPQKLEEIKQKGVPSKMPNPLNMFRQPLHEEKQQLNDKIETQVPGNNLPNIIENQPSLSTPEKIELYTENHVSNENTPSISTTKKEVTFEAIEPKVEELKAKIEHTEIKKEEIQYESVEEHENLAEQFENELEENSKQENIEKDMYEKDEEPTFVDTVDSKYNSIVTEEIPPSNKVEENIENISGSVDTTEQTIEHSAIEDEVIDKTEENEEPGFFSKIYDTLFGSKDKLESTEETFTDTESDKSEIVETASEKTLKQVKNSYESMWVSHLHEKPLEKYLPTSSDPGSQNKQSDMESCDSSDNPTLCGVNNQNEFAVQPDEFSWSFEAPENAYNIFLYLSLTAVTVLLFSLGFYYIEKKRKDNSLVVSINNLEKRLLVSTKECLMLHDELKTTKERLASIENSSFGSNEMVTSLKEELEEAKITRIELEEQVANLEKELENATEAGMELNRMLREILTSQSGNEHLMQNVEHLQKQLNEQQETINSMKVTLGAKNTENELLTTELSVANEKNVQLQDELDKMVVNLLSVQEEKNNMENKLEEQIEKLKSEYEKTIKQINNELNILKDDNNKLKQTLENTQRVLDLKSNEYDLLKQGMKDIQTSQSNKDSVMALLDVSHVKAEVLQLRDEKHKLAEKLQTEVDEKLVFEKEVQVMIQEVKILKDKFDEAEKEKVEAQTRLEVLSTYFKEKETQLQKEINEHESKFMQKEGEATSTIERIKWIQEELQNYKAQSELLKKEILDQEVSLKSQISMLEKKSHDNWVLARQAERKLEESKQEASQLRNRLTIVEKNLNNSTHIADESKLSNRIMSPLESNGELPVSPLHMSQVDASGSPPLLFPHRDHMTTSPPMPGLPPFMPPPPGVPFMPPPMPGVPPFMPPPPALFPGDHRPPPLGRMSSPPLHGRYSPDSRAYSPYDRDDSPPLSPAYPDSDYRRRSPPPPNRIYSPYSGNKPTRHWERDDREFRGQQRKPRTHKGLSSGSGNSNESLDNNGRHSGRV